MLIILLLHYRIEKRAASKRKRAPKDGGEGSTGAEPAFTWSNVYEGPQKRPRVEKASEESVVNDRKLKEVLGKVF